MSKVILLVENNTDYLTILKERLELEGYKVLVSSTPYDAEKLVQNITIHLIVTDLRALDDSDEMDKSGLIFARTVAPTIPKIILTGFPSYQDVVDALRLDEMDLPPAIDFIDKRQGFRALLQAIEVAFQKYVRLNVSQVKTGGALTASEGASYAERDAEKKALSHLKRMDYLLIIEPRQQGKTSLTNYLMRHPELKNFAFVYVDTTTPDHSSEEGWYATLCARILDQLSRIFTSETWPDIPQNSVEWRQFLSGLAQFVQQQEKHLAVALDEIGAIRFPEYTNFFSVLRDIYNARQTEPEFYNLTFILVGTFHPRDLIDKDGISPFNISQRIRLHDFTLSQVNQLVSRFSWSEEQSLSIAKQIHYWTNGQPYLTQRLSNNLQPDSTPLDIDNAIDTLCREDDNHIAPLLKKVMNSDSLKAYIKQVHSGEKIVFYPLGSPIQSRLDLLGLIRADEDGCCVIRNRIYQRMLTLFEMITTSDKEQVTKNTEPEAELLNFTELHRLITYHFDEEELRTLCFDLEIQYDSLSGSNKDSKVRELISFLERRQGITLLLKKFVELRPGVSIGKLYK